MEFEIKKIIKSSYFLTINNQNVVSLFKRLEKIESILLYRVLEEEINYILNNINQIKKEELRNFLNFNIFVIFKINKFLYDKRLLELKDKFLELLIKLRKINRIDEMMYIEFISFHLFANNFQTIDEWREFNNTFTKESTKGYKKIIKDLPKIKPKRKTKKRIAFVKDRIVFNSPFKVEYSLFKYLVNYFEFKENYEIIIYSFSQFEKGWDDIKAIKMLKNLDIKVKTPFIGFFDYDISYLEKTLKLREILIKDNIDIFISYGVYPFMNFLYMSRVAPIQIYYCHGNCAYDVEGIDKRISHFNQECKDFKWNIFPLKMDKKFLIGTKKEKKEGKKIKRSLKKRFGRDLVILGTISRLVKIDSDEYLETISKIMKENPNTIYLACGGGNIETIKNKLKKYNIDENKFIFTGYINPHVYGWVIDIWLDTFPLRGGSAKGEFKAKKGFLIEYCKGYHGQKLKNRLNDIKLAKPLSFPNVFSKEEYIVIANKAIKDKKYRKKIAKIQKKNELREVNTYKIITYFQSVVVIWLLGISGSGKTTLSREIKKYLDKNKVKNFRIDGDYIRDFFDRDLGYSKEERIENIKRVLISAKVLEKNGIVPIISNISPFEELRKFARERFDNYIEIYLKRDIKKIKNKDFVYSDKNVVGIDMEFDEPKNPNLVIDTGKLTIKESLKKIIKVIDEHKC